MTKTKVTTNSSLLSPFFMAVAFLCFSADAFADGPGDISRKAFYAIEKDPFNTTVIEQADKDIGLAYKQDPNDPWVLIAASDLMLIEGYVKGERSVLSSYKVENVERSAWFARQAVAHGSKESMAYVQRARLQVLAEDFKGASLSLNKAHDLAPDSFYPWYSRGVLSLRVGDDAGARPLFEEAGKRATQIYQSSWVLGRLSDLAERSGDEAEIERLYRKQIEIDPGDAYACGNYAHYLKAKKRYAEAIVYYRKAIAIRPYGIAQEELRQTLLLQDAQDR